MNPIPVLVDDVLQVYDSNGNRHLIFGTIMGKVTPAGSDISEPSAHLIIPGAKINHLMNLLKTALSLGEDGSESVPIEITNETHGSPLMHIDAKP